MQHTQVHQVCLQQLPSTRFVMFALCVHIGGALLPMCVATFLKESSAL